MTEITKALKDFIREPYAWPGGYTKQAVMDDGEVLCYDCVVGNYKIILFSTRTKAKDGWELAGVDVYWEGPPATCTNCGKELPAEYGDPESVGD